MTTPGAPPNPFRAVTYSPSNEILSAELRTSTYTSAHGAINAGHPCLLHAGPKSRNRPLNPARSALDRSSGRARRPSPHRGGHGIRKQHRGQINSIPPVSLPLPTPSWHPFRRPRVILPRSTTLAAPLSRAPTRPPLPGERRVSAVLVPLAIPRSLPHSALLAPGQRSPGLSTPRRQVDPAPKPVPRTFLLSREPSGFAPP